MLTADERRIPVAHSSRRRASSRLPTQVTSSAHALSILATISGSTIGVGRSLTGRSLRGDLNGLVKSGSILHISSYIDESAAKRRTLVVDDIPDSRIASAQSTVARISFFFWSSAGTGFICFSSQNLSQCLASAQ